MGTVVPGDWPDLEDEKWYRCIIHIYADETPATDCTQTHKGVIGCCRTGLDIKDWLAADKECKNENDLCPFPAVVAQRLVAIHGPYDTQMECMA